VRLFVAVDIGDETRAQLRRVRNALERHLAEVRRAPRVTWVAAESAHVTVRFIGEVPEATAERVRAALASPFSIAPYELELSEIGGFPNHRRPRVVWIGIKAGQQETAQVAAAVNARLEPVVGAGEERPFRAHLTVARVKEFVPFDWDAAFQSIEAGRTVSRIDRVTLYQSRTSPRGPTYTALCATALAAARE
jgi:2'-5' RNA ligase